MELLVVWYHIFCEINVAHKELIKHCNDRMFYIFLWFTFFFSSFFLQCAIDPPSSTSHGTQLSWEWLDASSCSSWSRPPWRLLPSGSLSSSCSSSSSGVRRTSGATSAKLSSSTRYAYHNYCISLCINCPTAVIQVKQSNLKCRVWPLLPYSNRVGLDKKLSNNRTGYQLIWENDPCPMRHW